MRQRAIWQRKLFEDSDAFQLPPLPQEVQQELSRLLARLPQLDFKFYEFRDFVHAGD